MSYTPDEIRGQLVRQALKILEPCLWHGVDGGPRGPQPEGGAGYCSQCERRHQPMLVMPAALLKALEVET